MAPPAGSAQTAPAFDPPLPAARPPLSRIPAFNPVFIPPPGASPSPAPSPLLHFPVAPGIGDAAHLRALAPEASAPLFQGNRTRLLLDAPATYAAMFEAIDEARDHINIESYIIEAAGPGEELARRLAARCRAGVRVNVLFDSFGSLSTSDSYFDGLRRCGVNICEFNPLARLSTLLSRALHFRDHRKLMIVDGRIGFIGGVNIGETFALAPHRNRSRADGPDKETGTGQNPGSAGWRDTHVRIEGPVVAELQRLFFRQWQHYAQSALLPGRYFPTLAPVGEQPVALAASDAGRRRNVFYRALLRAIGAARQRILLTCAYFVPTRRLLRTLCRAAARGVEVRLVLPGVSDCWAPLHAGRSHYARLLKAGVRIHERHDTLLHAKTCVIDGLWTTIGSSNLDWRSLLHNAEANIIALDPEFAAEVETVFWDDVSASREVRLEDWLRRGLWQRTQEWFARRYEFFL